MQVQNRLQLVLLKFIVQELQILAQRHVPGVEHVGGSDRRGEGDRPGRGERGQGPGAREDDRGGGDEPLQTQRAVASRDKSFEVVC